MTAFCSVIVNWYAMTHFSPFNGMAFANEAGLVGVGYAPCLADCVATETAHVVVGAELGIQIFHLFANTTKLQHLADVYFRIVLSVVDVFTYSRRHYIEHMQDFFKCFIVF
jgi:hypothetical protein